MCDDAWKYRQWFLEIVLLILEYILNDDFSLQTGLGKVISKEGNLNANTFEVSLVWRFATPK